MCGVDGDFGAVCLSSVGYAFFAGLIDGDGAVWESFVVSVEGVDRVGDFHGLASLGVASFLFNTFVVLVVPSFLS